MMCKNLNHRGKIFSLIFFIITSQVLGIDLDSLGNPILPRAPVSVMTNSLQENLPKGEANHCYVEYQVTKRRAGHCVQFGQSARGCIAGSYMNPFHPDCM